ncbi:MAG: N-acetyl sugar amidotransferase [Bacteroidetes bacterium]|nr:N-acetyl sugar amidotransferase [Bacteroidota bacterium]
MKACPRCILNSEIVKHIEFDEKSGLCNFCINYDNLVEKIGDEKQRSKWIADKIAEIKHYGKGKKFDCILGVSGGVDSTYLAYWCKKNELRPLIVHFDNGWNSELAVQNIQNICSKLDFDLQTIVINWDEFKELQLAYLRSGVIDMEVLTDHAIAATITQIASKHKIKYLLSGFNIATEAIMPSEWVYDKLDWENIKDIYDKYGNDKPLKTFPHLTFKNKILNYWFFKTELIQVLNYINYNKADAKKIITSELNWRDYGGKHYESIFTKFYQAYILPQKFKVDKRYAHLSNLICSKQITKEEAVKELELPLYNSQNDLQSEKRYVLKKLTMTEEEFDAIMKRSPQSHHNFKTEKEKWNRYFKIIKLLKFNFK